MRATYDPADNKLRLYPDDRLDGETYKRVRDAGFIWAGKQKLFVAPMWTPDREDLLLELCEEIGDEDTTLAERAEQRSERFEEYREHRERDAHSAHAAVERVSGRFEFGQPILVGHHSERKARKDAEKIESGMRRAVKMWETSKYWEDRAAGAIRHARYKERPSVRVSRIQRLESEKRGHERTIVECERSIKNWNLVLSKTDPDEQYAYALQVANVDSRSYRAWGEIRDRKTTPDDTAAKAIDASSRTIAWANRWIQQLTNRITYETTLLNSTGGLVADVISGTVKPEKGGAIQHKSWGNGSNDEWYFVDRLNKVTVAIRVRQSYGDHVYIRKIKLQDISGIMSAAEVMAAIDAGKVTLKTDKTGFFTHECPEPKHSTPRDESLTVFDAMRESLSAGVQVATGDELFPTPREIATQMIQLADIPPGATVLEPSAGTGRLIEALPETNPYVIAIEKSAKLAEHIRSRGIATQIFNTDFMGWLPTNGLLFDRVIMNPPFSNGQDVLHVRHAFLMLKPGGILVAITSKHWTFARDLRSIAFREFFEEYGDTSIELPADTFKESGTAVSTVMIRLTKPQP